MNNNIYNVSHIDSIRYSNFGRQNLINPRTYLDYGELKQYGIDTAHNTLNTFEYNERCFRYETDKYIEIIRRDIFRSFTEYKKSKNSKILCLCNRILLFNFDNDLFWICDKLPHNYYCLEINSKDSESQIFRFIYEWNRDFLYFGKCTIHNNCLILNKATSAVVRPNKLKINTLSSRYNKWEETKYAVLAGDYSSAIIYETDSGFLVQQNEADPIMKGLGYNHYYGHWACPGFWSKEEKSSYCNKDECPPWFNSFESQINTNESRYFALKTTENYNYGIYCAPGGIMWSYTEQRLQDYCSTLRVGGATINRDVLVMHGGVDKLSQDLGEFDSDSFFSSWPAWTGSRYFIPPTGKYLYYAATGNMVPLDEAYPVMARLGYTLHPSMIVGDTEAGLFWYKPAVGEAPLAVPDPSN